MPDASVSLTHNPSNSKVLSDDSSKTAKQPPNLLLNLDPNISILKKHLPQQPIPVRKEPEFYEKKLAKVLTSAENRIKLEEKLKS